MWWARSSLSEALLIFRQYLLAGASFALAGGMYAGVRALGVPDTWGLPSALVVGALVALVSVRFVGRHGVRVRIRWRPFLNQRTAGSSFDGRLDITVHQTTIVHDIAFTPPRVNVLPLGTATPTR
jgi:hypothetical protein